MWRQIDLRKSKRKQKLVERTQTKLEKATSRQVDQILTFNHLLDTLSKHDQTMTRFQANSSTLHRCLIKWDKLKAHDRSFTRTSIRLALELQSFMSQMDNYFRIPHERPAHHLLQQHRQQQVIVVEETTNITTTTTTTSESIEEEEPSTQITPSPISLNEAFVEIITAGPSHLRIDDEPSMPNYSATVSTTRTAGPLPTATATTTTTTTTTIVQSINNSNNSNSNNNNNTHSTNNNPRAHEDHAQDPQPQPQSHDRSKLGFRKQIVLKYKLGQLRFKTKKFNQKFEDHEARKLRLKLNGNQCIFNMVEDGKTLLELNESIIDLVFHLCLLRNPKR
ncbi:hypothetical protein PTTG_04812 [Puccinia triticina 1-1 BBBD Race 1]|uniref:Uncharacterized protein n=1 Tax=Puccinia triticina (isolate 1-1 / race 1 (BBBD)) TaxID=630390 RepID=A0A180GSZ6_PUCT1|nr:hypothetical protein PTTG_04812 [Puccinia triticina 1-1 BBBD Race 1]